MALSKDFFRSQSALPWLPLWGSCHEVTERVKFALSDLLGISLIGRGKLPSSVSHLRKTREPPMHYGMIATGNHRNFDSLRRAPPSQGKA